MSVHADYTIPPAAAADTIARPSTAPIADVLLFHTVDGGEIEFIGGEPTMSDGLETSAYLSLFGGNDDDANLDGTAHLQWWGNLGENDGSKHYRSETQYLLKSLPATSANLRRLEDAVKRDLSWMLSEFAKNVSCGVSIPALNRAQIELGIEVKSGTKYRFVFTEGWGAA